MLPEREDFIQIFVACPNLAGHYVVDVRHLALVHAYCAELFTRRELLEFLEVLLEPFLDIFVARVRIAFPCLSPVLDEPVGLNLE